MATRKTGQRRNQKRTKWYRSEKHVPLMIATVVAVGVFGVLMIFNSFAAVAPVGISGNWSLVFDDEFNGTVLDSQYWNPSWFSGGKVNSNGATMSSNNQKVSGGDLILTLASTSSGATVDTDPSQTGGKGFQFGTGYVTEARMYIPGNGTAIYNWPAFWTDGQSWPADGESDIFEGLGTATSNYHSPNGANNSGTIAGTWSNGWHTYALDREANKDYIYWDGKLVRSYTPDDGGSPQYLIFSLDCSGGCKTGTANQLKVDYVRVWKKGTVNPTPPPPPPTPPPPAPSPTPQPHPTPTPSPTSHPSSPAPAPAKGHTTSPSPSPTPASSTKTGSSGTSVSPATDSGSTNKTNFAASATSTKNHKSGLSTQRLLAYVTIAAVAGILTWLLVLHYRL